jgi:hypothetical protein
MGGMRSGLYGGGGKLSKRSVESCPNLNMRILQKQNVFAHPAFLWEWKNQRGEWSMTVKLEEYGLLLIYKIGDEKKKVKIFITETQAGFGKVKWFLCPSCGDRRAILYLVGGKFACRVCHNLNYTSSQATDELDYYHWQLQKLCNRLKAEYEPTSIFPPERPKGMHQKTYSAIYLKYRVLAHKRDEAWMQRAGAIISKHKHLM